MLCDPVLMFYEQQPMSHVHVSAWADSIHWDYTLTSLPSWWVNTYHVEVRKPAGILIMCTPVSVHACIRQVIFSQCPPDPLTFDLQSYVDQRPKAAQTALNFKLFALDLSVFELLRSPTKEHLHHTLFELPNSLDSFCLTTRDCTFEMLTPGQWTLEHRL